MFEVINGVNDRANVVWNDSSGSLFHLISKHVASQWNNREINPKVYPFYKKSICKCNKKFSRKQGKNITYDSRYKTGKPLLDKAKNIVASCTILLSIWKKVTKGTKIGGPSGTDLSECLETLVLKYEEYLNNI